jgi:hypothetical protein
MTGDNFTSKYHISCVGDSYRFQFFCSLCEHHHTSGWISADTQEQARLLAEKEAKKYFNKCHKCGKWICDEHYNRDEMVCVECAPPEAENK